jgi:hypothetical protein
MGADKGRQMGMPLPEFVAKAWDGLAKGDDQVYVGVLGSGDRFFSIAHQRRAACEDLARLMKRGGGT